MTQRMEKHYRKAIAYAAENIEPFEIDYVVGSMERYHCPAYLVNGTCQNAIDYLNEYASDNDIPEEFWTDDHDDDDIIYDIYDLIHAE